MTALSPYVCPQAPASTDQYAYRLTSRASSTRVSHRAVLAESTHKTVLRPVSVLYKSDSPAQHISSYLLHNKTDYLYRPMLPDCTGHTFYVLTETYENLPVFLCKPHRGCTPPKRVKSNQLIRHFLLQICAKLSIQRNICICLNISA